MARGDVRDLAKYGEEVQDFEIPYKEGVAQYQVVAKLMYRKADQYLINFLLGEDSGLTAPVIEMNRAWATIDVLDEEEQAEMREDGDGSPVPSGG
jgi:hypothetical protein